MPNRIILSSISFFVGVALGLLFDLGLFHAFFLVLLSLTIVFLRPFTGRQIPLFYFITLVSIAIGLFRVDIDRKFAPLKELDRFLEVELSVEGLVSSNPEKREKTQVFEFKPNLYRSKILVYAEKFSDIKYGDRFIIEGKLQPVENFEGLRGRVFDYENYLSKDDIYYQVFYPKLEKVGEEEGDFIKSKLFALKNALTDNIKKIIPSPEDLLLSGLLFGEKSSLGDSLEEDFKRAGLVHIVVLSGYNVSIIADAVIRSLAFAGVLASSLLSVLAIFLFAILTGLGPATLRASIMASLALLSRVSGRKYELTGALFFAGAIMVLANPRILLYDPGFELSFLATLGLILLAPLFVKRMTFFPDGLFKELLGATLSTQIFVLPLLLYQIGELSIIAPLSNLLVLPLIPSTMLLGFLTSLSAGFPLLGEIFGFLSFLFLKTEISIVSFLSDFPLASVIAPKFSFILVPIFYIFIGYFIWRANSNKKKAF